MRDGDSAIHMAPYTEGRAPSMACRICDDDNAVYILVDISGYMNDQ
jgi:hypothetical protein